MSTANQHNFELKFAARGTEAAIRDLRQVIRSVDMAQMGIRGMLLQLERLNLPPDVKASISVLNTMISTVYALRTAMITLQAVSGPAGWAMLIAGAGVGIGTYAYSQIELERASREW